MAWDGLFHCYCLDAERENGDFLNTLWKLSMIGLWSDNHNKLNLYTRYHTSNILFNSRYEIIMAD